MILRKDIRDIFRKNLRYYRLKSKLNQDEKNKEWKKGLLGIICGTIVIAANGSIGYKLYEKR